MAGSTQLLVVRGEKRTSVWTILLTGLCLAFGCQESGENGDSDWKDTPAVSSTQLVETEIVPSLDSPVRESGNVIWCATFQVAWNRAKDDPFHGPIQIRNAQPVADRLNGSPITESALPPGCFFATAGRLEDGIKEEIQQQMSRQFPNAPLPEFPGAARFIAYAYLESEAKFTTPFVDNPLPIPFKDAAGTTHSVRGFGLHAGTDRDLLKKQSAQVRVLFSEEHDTSNRSTPAAFALDLTADQPEQQVIVAVLPRAENLQRTLDDLSERMKKSAPKEEYYAKLHEIDVLAIPNISFHLNHDFTELQGTDKVIENTGNLEGLFIGKASQAIQFRLDKSGAAVISESKIFDAAIPRLFVIDRPFLVIMKRRSSEHPYLVAWVDNAELLEKSHQTAPAP